MAVVVNPGLDRSESEEVYKRQVLSITCIAMGISFLGTLCMALYCRNKRRREKLQAHLKESRGLKNYSVSQPCKAHTGLQLHSYPPHGAAPDTPTRTHPHQSGRALGPVKPGKKRGARRGKWGERGARRGKWGERGARQQGQRVPSDIHRQAEEPSDVHSQAEEPSDVHRRAAEPSDIHRRAAEPSDVPRRAVEPSDDLSPAGPKAPEGREGGTQVRPVTSSADEK
ncbi:hypothetical protein QTP70_006761 [Hemibagrus guttatus]|uniref:Uncharacterized protein n=1 Tax=Hemibagrus guttatus TaxID=175788 RepID=A0AAE0RH08_9TELE|nr:hypothetical protein QTP70_006761 [Hemibagrus guttatus]